MMPGDLILAEQPTTVIGGIVKLDGPYGPQNGWNIDQIRYVKKSEPAILVAITDLYFSQKIIWVVAPIAIGWSYNDRWEKA